MRVTGQTSTATPRSLRLPALVVGGISALTLLLTLAWQIVIARTFGATAELDAFWVALGLPRSIAESFHLGLLTLLFVIVFQRDRHTAGDDAWRQASAALNVTLVVTAVGIVALVALAPWLVPAMAPGLPDDAQALAVSLLRWLSLMLVPTAVAAGLGGLAIARGRLLPFALSRAMMPALQIATALALAATFGVRALVWALWAGAIAAVLVFVPWLKRSGLRYYGGFGLDRPATRQVLRLQLVLAVVWIVITLNQVVDRYFASLLGAGAVSALEFAWRFEIPISQVVSLGVALPTFAILAQSASETRDAEFRSTLAASARLLVMAVVPLLGFMVVLREPLARVWLERGAFSAESAQLVASLLPFLAVVYFCRAFAPILVFGLLTIGRPRLLVGGLVGELALHTVLASLLGPAMGLAGVALAGAAAMAIVNVGLWIVLLREIQAVSLGAALVHARSLLAASLIAVALLEAVRRVFGGLTSLGDGFTALGPLAVIGTGYLAVYVAVCAGTGAISGAGLVAGPTRASMARPVK